MRRKQVLDNIMHTIKYGHTFCDVLCEAIRSNNNLTFDQACQLAESYNVGQIHAVSCSHNFYTWCVKNANNIRHTPLCDQELQDIKLALLSDPNFIAMTK